MEYTGSPPTDVTVNVTSTVAVAPPVVAVKVTVAVYVPGDKAPVNAVKTMVTVPLASRLPDVGENDSQPEPEPYTVAEVQLVAIPEVSESTLFCVAGLPVPVTAVNVRPVGEVDSVGLVIGEKPGVTMPTLVSPVSPLVSVLSRLSRRVCPAPDVLAVALNQ